MGQVKVAGSFDVESIERATVAAVAPAHVEELAGWLLAYDGGAVNRARSAVPLSHAAPDADAIGEIVKRYRTRGVPPNFRVPLLESMARVERALAQRDLHPGQPTRVMLANAADAARAADPMDVRIAASPDDAWTAVFLGEGFDPVDGASRVATLKRAPGSLFAAVHEGARVVAGGVLAMSHGWASIHGMRTAQSHRSRGLATRILAALAREALARGHGRIALQVEDANPAVRVYERCGFVHAWTYAYWREPQ